MQSRPHGVLFAATHRLINSRNFPATAPGVVRQRNAARIFAISREWNRCLIEMPADFSREQRANSSFASPETPKMIMITHIIDLNNRWRSGTTSILPRAVHL